MSQKETLTPTRQSHWRHQLAWLAMQLLALAFPEHLQLWRATPLNPHPAGLLPGPRMAPESTITTRLGPPASRRLFLHPRRAGELRARPSPCAT